MNYPTKNGLKRCKDRLKKLLNKELSEELIKIIKENNMKTSSCKAKGRRCSSEIKELLMQDSPTLQDDDIIITPSGVTGEDLTLSPLARAIYPFTFEAKNVEKLNIWNALLQSESHQKKDYIPTLWFKRNRSELYVSLKAKDFIKLIKK